MGRRARARRCRGIAKHVKTGLIITVAIVVAAFVFVYAWSTNYYSDYNRCLRFMEQDIVRDGEIEHSEAHGDTVPPSQEMYEEWHMMALYSCNSLAADPH